MIDLDFTQTERVESIDGDRESAAMQVKPSLDTGAVAFAHPGASEEWVVDTGILPPAWTVGEDIVRGALSASFFRRTIYGCRPSDELSLRHSPKDTQQSVRKTEKTCHLVIRLTKM